MEEILGSPARVRIILALWKYGEMNLTELAKRSGVSQRPLAEHLEALISHGIVEVKEVGRVKLYRLSRGEDVRKLAEALADADEYLKRDAAP